jgi:hypothetical protein
MAENLGSIANSGERTFLYAFGAVGTPILYRGCISWDGRQVQAVVHIILSNAQL